MKAEEVPQCLIDILDKRAGKKHSRQGPVIEALAEILTHYREMITYPHHDLFAHKEGV